MSKEVNKSVKQKPSKIDRKVHRAVNKISKDVGPIFSKEPTNVSPNIFQIYFSRYIIFLINILKKLNPSGSLQNGNCRIKVS